MTYEEMVKKFPIGSKAILVNNRGIATGINSIGTIEGHAEFPTGELALYINWDVNTLTHYQENGGYWQDCFEPYNEQLPISSYHQQNKNHSKCPLCSSEGVDLVFKFYCYNNSCRNYHK